MMTDKPRLSTETHQKVAWIHRESTTLTTDDAVLLKFSLKELIKKATDTLADVRRDIALERMRLKDEEREAA